MLFLSRRILLASLSHPITMGKEMASLFLKKSPLSKLVIKFKQQLQLQMFEIRWLFFKCCVSRNLYWFIYIIISFVLQKGKRHPPLLRDYPPVAGSITWERQLYDRLKKKVLSFQNVKEFENSALKTNVSFIYLFVVFI